MMVRRCMFVTFDTNCPPFFYYISYAKKNAEISFFVQKSGIFYEKLYLALIVKGNL